MKESSVKYYVNIEFEKEAKKELAFECDGIKFFQFTDGGIPMYYKRFQAMQETLRKHDEWKITGEVLKEYVDLIKKHSAKGGKEPQKQLWEIERLTAQFEWRMNQDSDVMLVYDLASVWFFTDEDDPADYHRSKALSYIKMWTMKPELFFFFVNTPLNRFVPLERLLETGTLSYLQSLYQTVLGQLANSFSMLSESEKSESIGQNIKWQMETYLNLLGLIDSGSLSTSTLEESLKMNNKG
mgnify:CR=1 FL=1